VPQRIRRALSIDTGCGATFWYSLATLAMTWPLVAGLGHDMPWDFGDSVLNSWILQWATGHAMRFLGGDLGAFSGYFNANIFYPEPLTLAYSEHLTAQMIQVLPVYALTGNIVLCHNLLFLSTFVLSGLGTYLLVRELTGSSAAGFVAGLFYAFAPYRIGQFSHVQVLSSQWMPFALYLFRRYFATRSLGALAGASAALVAQNWSCGYYLLYFSPFAAAYVIYELVERGAWRGWRVWIELAGAAVLVFAATIPLLLPYLALRARGFGPRPFGEVLQYSADVYSYLTAHGAQRVWGEVARAFPKLEGDAFPALVPVLLALIGLAAHAVRVWRASRVEPRLQHDASGARWRRPIVVAAFVLLVSQLAAAVIILFTGGFDWQVAGTVFRVQNLARALRTAAMAGAVLLVLSPRARAFVRGVPRSAVLFSLVALVSAFLLSLGPIIFSKGVRVAGDGPYWWLYLNVPGYDGLRVPARLVMIFALFLAVLGGYGCASVEGWIERASRRSTPAAPRSWWPRAAVLVIGVIFLVEATSAPVQVNGIWTTPGLAPPPARLLIGNEVPNVYRAVDSLPTDAVLIEFPFGDDQYDMRYMVASASHWRPLVNGYSGGAPASYYVNRAALTKVLARPDRSWNVLWASGATHAIVHEKIYLDDTGPKVSEWLLSHGARQIGWFGSDRLFELPR
jgi:hypothetical protein